MGGVEVEVELGPVVDGGEGLLSGPDVVGDARWLNLQLPLHPVLLELIEDDVPALVNGTKPTSYSFSFSGGKMYHLSQACEPVRLLLAGTSSS